MRGGLRGAIVAVVWLGVVVTGCGGDRPSPVEEHPAGLPASLTFRCGTLLIPIEAFSNPLGVETGAGDAAAALRAFTKRGLPSGEEPTRDSYRVLQATADAVLFGTDLLGPEGLRAVVAERQGDRWSARGLGLCRPALELAGLNAATWSLAAGDVMPGPAIVRVTALVSETPCVDGRPADGRILPPTVIREASRLLVVFAVRPLSGPAGLGAACPRPPPTPVEVDLGGPLGNRELLDGGVWPPAPVWHPECCG